MLQSPAPSVFWPAPTGFGTVTHLRCCRLRPCSRLAECSSRVAKASSLCCWWLAWRPSLSSLPWAPLAQACAADTASNVRALTTASAQCAESSCSAGEQLGHWATWSVRSGGRLRHPALPLSGPLLRAHLELGAPLPEAGVGQVGAEHQDEAHQEGKQLGRGEECGWG